MSTSPASADAPTRRVQILREAARLFAARGFHGVGVDEIGAAVGISGPGLYRHFAGKDAMLAELLVGISERLLAGGRARLAAAEGPPEAVLDSLLAGHIDFALDDRALIVLHDRELARLRDEDRRRVRRLQREYVELWVDTLRKGPPHDGRADGPRDGPRGLRPSQLDPAPGGGRHRTDRDGGTAAAAGAGGVRGGV
ncbi:LOW QUALITY PROTEIN: TetR-family transcriptional regulator, partial [Streptomyces sp. SPB78]